jgi:MFS family permease
MTTTLTPPKTAIRRLAVARVISITGGAAAYVALNFSIYERTKSPAWVAAALFLTFGVAGFLMPFGGWLGDRFDRRKVMIWSDLAGAGAFLGMALVEDPAFILVFAFLSAVAEAPFWAASAAAIPNLVEDEKDLGWANGLVNIGRQAGIFIGPFLGGLAAVSADAVFLSNAVSFVISALIIASVRARFSTHRKESGEVQGGFFDGIVFIARDRVLRLISGAWLGIVLGLGMAMAAEPRTWSSPRSSAPDGSGTGSSSRRGAEARWSAPSWAGG